MFLQSHTTPIYTYKMNSNGVPQALKLKGTGFFLGTGTLITAAHVLKAARRDIDVGVADGVCANPLVPTTGGASQNIFIDIKDFDVADAPYDVAVANTSYNVKSPRFLGNINVEIADDVATLGYPESASQVHDGKIYVQARVHRGYVQRVVPKDRLFVSEKNPKLYELNFAVTKGMSGSPLMIMKQNREFVIGVCVGTHSSELIDYSTKLIDDDGKSFSEKHLKVQEYGMAHDLTSLLKWCPDVLNGRSLEAACN